MTASEYAQAVEALGGNKAAAQALKVSVNTVTNRKAIGCDGESELAIKWLLQAQLPQSQKEELEARVREAVSAILWTHYFSVGFSATTTTTSTPK